MKMKLKDIKYMDTFIVPSATQDTCPEYAIASNDARTGLAGWTEVGYAEGKKYFSHKDKNFIVEVVASPTFEDGSLAYDYKLQYHQEQIDKHMEELIKLKSESPTELLLNEEDVDTTEDVVQSGKTAEELLSEAITDKYSERYYI